MSLLSAQNLSQCARTIGGGKTAPGDDDVKFHRMLAPIHAGKARF